MYFAFFRENGFFDFLFIGNNLIFFLFKGVLKIFAVRSPFFLCEFENWKDFRKRFFFFMENVRFFIFRIFRDIF